MRSLANIALGLILATTSLSAQTGLNQAPVPGPYLVINHPQPVQPTFTPQRFAMPMPYWMQNTRQPQERPLTPAPSQPAVGRAPQQPVDTDWSTTAPLMQNNGATPTPGFFPSYNSGQHQAAPRPPTSNTGLPYPNNNFAPMPWNQYGTGQYAQQFRGQNYGNQQGFMPMPPWQNGQNGWGNNWNNNGYGYQQGYAAPNWPRRQGLR